MNRCESDIAIFLNGGSLENISAIWFLNKYLFPVKHETRIRSLENKAKEQEKQLVSQVNLYINLACLSVCLFVCLFVSNKRQNGWTDRAQIFCGTSRDPKEGLWMIKISNICLHQNLIFIKFLKILKSTKFFVKIANYFCFFLRCTQREHVHN